MFYKTLSQSENTTIDQKQHGDFQSFLCRRLTYINDITGFPPCHMGCFIKSYSSLAFIYVPMRGFPHDTSLNDRCLAGICTELCTRAIESPFSKLARILSKLILHKKEQYVFECNTKFLIIK